MATGNPLINPTTAKWKTADTPQLLRGIYVELRIQNLLLANGLNIEPYLDTLRKDMTSVFPDVGDAN